MRQPLANNWPRGDSLANSYRDGRYENGRDLSSMGSPFSIQGHLCGEAEDTASEAASFAAPARRHWIRMKKSAGIEDIKFLLVVNLSEERCHQFGWLKGSQRSHHAEVRTFNDLKNIR